MDTAMCNVIKRTIQIEYEECNQNKPNFIYEGMIVAGSTNKACFAPCPIDVVRSGKCSCNNKSMDNMKEIASNKRFSNLKNRKRE